MSMAVPYNYTLGRLQWQAQHLSNLEFCQVRRIQNTGGHKLVDGESIGQAVDAGMMIFASTDCAKLIPELTVHATMIEVSTSPAHLPRAGKVAGVITCGTILSG